ncbi:MAG: phytanoyl-CoA dioxygenase family protein [Candidatus Solibacter sp.]
MDGVDRVETVTRRRALARGYVFARGVLDSAPLAELRAQVIGICERCGWLTGRKGFAYDAPEFFELQREVQVLPSFQAVRAVPALRDLLERVLGGEIRDQQGDVCRMLFPGAPEFTTPPHQDQTYLKRAEEVWGAWIPLGDCPRKMGSLSVLPRSNRCGVTSAPPAGLRWRNFDFGAGDVLLVNSMTWHRALENRSSEIRVSVDLRYCAGVPARAG